MKNDYTFKFVAAIIIAGVIVALVSPAPSPDAPAKVVAEMTAVPTTTSAPAPQPSE